MKFAVISISMLISVWAMAAEPVVCSQINLQAEVAVYFKTKQKFIGPCLEKALMAAQIKGEIFERGLDANDKFFPSFLDDEADLKRLNPLLDKNGDLRE